MEKFKKIGGTVLAVIAIAAIVLFGIFRVYVWILDFSWEFCELDGVYLCEDEAGAVVVIFDENEMIMYTKADTYSTRTSYEYGGNYYNGGWFDWYRTPDEEWEKIPDVDEAGTFFADCKSSVGTNVWGKLEYLDEDQIETLGESNVVAYSRRFYFKISGNVLTLITHTDDETGAIPLQKTHVLTGEIGETVDTLDYLWKAEFG